MEPQLDFRRQLGWEMVENTLDEETKYGGVDGRQLRARRGTLEYHELVTDPKMVESGLLARINGGGPRNPTRSRYTTTKTDITDFLQVGISDAIRDSYCVLSVMQLMLLMLTPKN